MISSFIIIIIVITIILRVAKLSLVLCINGGYFFLIAWVEKIACFFYGNFGSQIKVWKDTLIDWILFYSFLLHNKLVYKFG